MQRNHPSVVESPAHIWFLNHLPEIRSRGHACLSRLRGDAYDEAMSEVVGSVFKGAVYAARSGNLERVTPYHAVRFAVKQFRQGRRLAGYSSTDVTAEAAQLKGRATVLPLPGADATHGSNRKVSRAASLSEELADRRQHFNPFEQARQNLDYACILKQEHINKKARKVFRLLSAVRGLGQGREIAKVLGISPARVCQLKQQLADALAKHDYAPN